MERHYRFVSLMLQICAMVCMAAAPLSAFAWGAKGHRITGLIAKELLTDEARKSLKAIMGSDELGKFALYMDEQKLALEKRMPGTRQWHYDDIPVCGSVPKNQYCPSGNCASTQITHHYGVLVDPDSSKAEKQFAIYVLTHMVGDIHQPLHSSDNDDRGGNNVKVQLPWSRNAKLNLHGIWDTDLIAHKFGDESEIAVAKRLVATYGDSITGWQKGKVSTWVNESHRIAEDVAYSLPDFACDTQFPGRVTISQAYVDKADATIEEQLAKAGARIAYILNRALGE